VVRRRDGEKGAERGRGLGPWMLAVIFRLDVGAINVEGDFKFALGISRYAEPLAEGTMPVCRTGENIS
jgi:hypothetical protein